jgi:hypothetical protein
VALETLRIGQPREILGRIRVEPRLERTAGDVDHALVCPLFDRDLRVGQQPRELDQEAARHDRAFTFDAGFERGAQRELHVGGGEQQAACSNVCGFCTPGIQPLR